MKFSIITTVKNGEAFLEESMRSVLEQEGDFEIEYILIDGGSTDHSTSICRKIISQIEQDPSQWKCKHIQIQLLEIKDHSMYEGLAFGFKKLSGDIVAYLNASDLYYPNTLQKVSMIFNVLPTCNWLTAHGTDISLEGVPLYDKLPFKYHHQLIQHGMYGTFLPYIHQASTFWKKELLELVNISTFKTCRYAGDFYLWYCFSKKHELCIANLKLAAHRKHGEQLSSNRSAYRSELRKIAKRAKWTNYIISLFYYIAWYDPTNLLRRMFRKSLCKYPHIVFR